MMTSTIVRACDTYALTIEASPTSDTVLVFATVGDLAEPEASIGMRVSRRDLLAALGVEV